MMQGTSYIRTDLASEAQTAAQKASGAELEGVRYTEESRGRRDMIQASILHIEDERGAKALGKPVGVYITLHIGKIWFADEEWYREAVEVAAGEIKALADRMAPDAHSILIAGLGNREITADAIGPYSVKSVNVTRHIRGRDDALYKSLGGRDIAAIAPGVAGQTGIDALDLIQGAAASVSPDLIIAIDALAARSAERLATTIQLTDNGIAPGSGIGNARRAVNQEEMGVPVLVIGVPTVVDSSTLVYDVLEQAGITELSAELTAILENGKSFFVSLKDSDLAVTSVSNLIADALNEAFSIRS